MNKEGDSNLLVTLEKLEQLAEQLKQDKNVLAQNNSLFFLRELIREQIPDENSRNTVSAIR